jgi:hypothetical protein
VDVANLGSESETCVGSRVRLVGVSISFEKNFYRLPFTPPSLVRRIGPSPEDSKGRKAASTPLSMAKEAKGVVKASPYHPQQVVPTLQGMSSRVLLNSEVMIWFTYFVVSCARGISG